MSDRRKWTSDDEYMIVDPADFYGPEPPLTTQLRWRACPAGKPWTGDDPASDHGHTDCWLFHRAADEIDRLRAAITEAVEELTAVHYPDPDLPRWCVMCSTADGSWPCITRMVADDLNDALKGTTDDD